MINIILVNGPPRSGKDTVGHKLRELDFMPVFKFAAPLKRAGAAFFNITEEELESLKDTEIEDTGARYRDMLIGFSEKVAKPLLGSGFFGRQLARELEDYLHTIPGQTMMRLQKKPCVVVTDCGFNTEIAALMQALPQHRYHLWQIDRPGYTYTGDSRKNVTPTQSMVYSKISNDGTLKEFKVKIKALYYSSIIGEKV